MGRVIAICTSEKKGTIKTEIPAVNIIKEMGLEDDAHAGSSHRQVSMLSLEAINLFREKGYEVSFGAFGENLVTEGLDLKKMKVGERLKVGEAVLELSRIGKSCHAGCSIAKTTGECIMPKEGLFFRVIEGGRVCKGDEIEEIGFPENIPFTAAVITLSDKSFAREREDESGEVLKTLLEEDGYKVTEKLILSDDKEPLKKELIRLADQRQVNVIFTTGGTGFSARDNTPEATAEVCTRQAPGIAEAIRMHSMRITPRAMLSRAVSGIRGETLIVNLPGSPKAVRESLDFILPELKHGLGVLRGSERECAR